MEVFFWTWDRWWFFYNPVTLVIDKNSNLIIYWKYGPFILHFFSILVITHVSRKEAKLNFVRPLTNEKEAFPLKIRKTTNILIKIFNIDNEKAKAKYE